jgi:DNA-binding beta-propeller fold protein YncE
VRPPHALTRTLTAALLALLWLWPQPAQAQCSPQHLFTFGGPGAADGQFNFPARVAVTPTGNIVVADTNNHRVQVFTSAGAHLFTLGGFGMANGQFGGPFGVAVDASGNIIVSEVGNNRIQVFTSAGAHLLTFGGFGMANGQFINPYGVAVDAAGNIVVIDSNNQRVQVFTGAGAHLLTFGGFGTGNGQFSNPAGVAVTPTGNIVVADTNNQRIQVFTGAGAHLLTFGGGGTGNGQFAFPRGVAVTPTGNIIVADTDNHRVQVFTSTGTHLLTFGGFGTANGQFRSPTGVAVDAAGRIIVADSNNNRIQVFAGCPPPPVANPAVSDQKAGSLLVFPYYTSAADGSFSKSDTLITITNVCNGAAMSAGAPNYQFLHLFFINGANCSPADTYVCLTPNGSIQLKASDYDPTVTGYLVAVAVDAQGRPTQNNCFVGSAFVRDDQGGVIDSYGAEAFWKRTAGPLAAGAGGNAMIVFGGDYDAAPVQFSAQVQDPAVADEVIVLASLSGDLGTALNSTQQTGVGVLYRADEAPASFQPQLQNRCLSITAIESSTIRIVPGNLATFLKDSYGYLKFNVTNPAVGLLVSRQGLASQAANRFSGIRTLHKTQVGAGVLLAPCFPPFCGF